MSLSNLILNNKYQLDHKVGSGSYGVVYSARHLYTGKVFGIKVILKKDKLLSPSTHTDASCSKKVVLELEWKLGQVGLNSNGQLKANLLDLDLISSYGYKCKILKEISLQLKVHKHPNILSIYKVFDSEWALFVVMDYYPEGDLFSTIVDKKRYSQDPRLLKSVFVQLVDAITYCHSKNVYHCDLKPENILVAENGTKLILADFGLAVMDGEIESNVCCGSSYYMAPERIQNLGDCYDDVNNHELHLERLANDAFKLQHSRHNVKFPTLAGDVWSLCIILINLISIRNPWSKASIMDVTFKAFMEDNSVLMRILPLSEEVYRLLKKYLRLNPYDRHSIFELRQDVIRVPKLSQSGPLSEECNVDDDELFLCQVPIDHVKFNRETSEDEGLGEPEPSRMQAKDHRMQVKELINDYKLEFPDDIMDGGLKDASDFQEDALVPVSSSSTPGTSVSDYEPTKSYVEFLSQQIYPPVPWK
ncbi:unnamed protein product [Kuraishia capsulata CBS 1993]|uniref:non-specific serine/threonine protein kinase n=1 Tax=Kuraishia capsulata CBS 1993 TaxID=1382522 RepID=W6MQM4_9ASCO|nr:uncharacterized protein KUCA_T00005020001 [Kuraishia capsulata CBS 1993]CDK29034.1 unnamed protein product [Kuraishia capsulata CBS 1993]